ncbi:hypothetical protein OL548_06925 [Lysinibacillus sp. MHQ-1]|nr:hypothetical protein OL548_06925 [Lysinibacillus sp. MHQ-1]
MSLGINLFLTPYEILDGGSSRFSADFTLFI